jgi:2-dehydropantoate 2-reductase
VISVGRAKGAPLAADFAENLHFIDAAPASMKASMAHDLERGNRLELDWLSGEVVALGRALEVGTPANQAIYAILKPYRMGNNAQSTA